jgi:hypothetical protein
MHGTSNYQVIPNILALSLSYACEKHDSSFPTSNTNWTQQSLARHLWQQLASPIPRIISRFERLAPIKPNSTIYVHDLVVMNNLERSLFQQYIVTFSAGTQNSNCKGTVPCWA